MSGRQDPTGRGSLWGAARRIGARFAFSYLIIYNLPFPLSLPPLGGPVADLYARFWHGLIPWVAANILRLSEPITVFPSGTGDTRFNYVQLLVFAVIAAVVTAIWTLAVRARGTSRSIPGWMRVYLRYALAVPLLTYGAAKVVKLQFPTPSLATSLQPLGELSPQETLWAWMGISYTYNLFTGLAEMIPGVLLLFRRTTTLGALLGAAALANVVVINFAYDVPVKLFSSHLLFMALVLLAPDVRRLLAVFVHNRPVPAADLGPGPMTPTLRVVRRVVKTAVVAGAIVIPLLASWRYAAQFGDRAARPPLFGVYEVDSFIRNGDTVLPLTTDASRWHRLIIGRPGSADVRLMDGSRRLFQTIVDGSAGHLTLARRTDSTRRSTLGYVAAGDTLVLDGLLEGDTLHVRLHRLDVGRTTRGFRWIRE